MKVFILSILLLITSSVVAQEDYINHLDKAGLRKQVLKELLKEYYYDRDNQNKSLAYDIAQEFMLNEDLDNAYKFFTLYTKVNPEDKEKELDAYFSRVQIKMLKSKFKEAKAELYFIPSHLIEKDNDRMVYLTGMVDIFDQEYHSGMETIKQLSYLSEKDYSYLDNLEKQLLKNHKRNHNIPKIMSYIIPGSGQMYNGDLKDGLNSLLLNSALIYTFIYLSNDIKPLNAGLSVGSWFYRYYTGGVKNAKKGSIDKANSNIQNAIHDLNQYLFSKKSNMILNK